MHRSNQGHPIGPPPPGYPASGTSIAGYPPVVDTAYHIGPTAKPGQSPYSPTASYHLPPTAYPPGP